MSDFVAKPLSEEQEDVLRQGLSQPAEGTKRETVLLPHLEENETLDPTHDYTFESKPFSQEQEDILRQGLSQSTGTKAEPILLPHLEERERVDPAHDYTPNDLIQDRFYNEIIAPVAKLQWGLEALDDSPGNRQYVVDAWLNNQRGYMAGNWMRTGTELGFHSRLSEDEKVLVAESYKLFNNMQGDYTSGEKLGATWDYIRSAVVDPANLLSLGIGKWVGKATGIGAQRSIMLAARKKGITAYSSTIAAAKPKKVVDYLANKGVSAELKAKAVRAASTAERGATKAMTANELARIATRRKAFSVALKEKFGTLSSPVWKEIGTTMSVDTAFAVGADFAYQHGLMDVGAQDEYSTAQTGLTALGVLLMGGIHAATLIPNPNRLPLLTDLPPPPKNATTTAATDALKDLAEHSEWKQMVLDGKWAGLDRVPRDFWDRLLTGYDDAAGNKVKGFGHVLLENNHDLLEDSSHIHFSHKIASILADADDEVVQDFLTQFKKTAGMPLPEKLSMEDFANAFALNMSSAGRSLGSAGSLKREFMRGIGVRVGNSVRTNEEILTGMLPANPHWRNAMTAGKNVARGKFARDLGAIQNGLIRSLVSHISTVARNVGGWTALSSVNTLSDGLLAFVHSGKAGLDFLAGNPSKHDGREFIHWLGNTKDKILSFADSTSTQEWYFAYHAGRPKDTPALKELRESTMGGIDVAAFFKAQDIDPKAKFDPNLFDKYVEFAQKAMWVEGQDHLTKSVEFFAQLDMNVRRVYGMSYADLYDQPGIREILASPEYINLEVKSAAETLKAVASFDYAKDLKVTGHDMVGLVADGLQEVRKIPMLGLSLPFGKFFNNTVFNFLDHTGASALYRMVSRTKNADMPAGSRSLEELWARTAVFMGISTYFATQVGDWEKRGLSQTEIPIGPRVVDVAYAWPLNMMVHTGRLLHGGRKHTKDEAVEVLSNMGGQLTRDLVGMNKHFYEFAVALLQEDPAPILDNANKLWKGAVENTVQAATRPLDPLNQLAGAFRDEYTIPDRRHNAWASSLKYLDQMIMLANPDAFGGPREYPLSGRPGPHLEALISPIVAPIRTTPSQRVARLAGVSEWKVLKPNEYGFADTIFTRYFNELLNSESEKLEASEAFIAPTDNAFNQDIIDLRAIQFQKMVEEVTQRTKDYMRWSADPADHKAILLMDLSNQRREHVRITFNNYSEETGFSGEIEDLEAPELQQLLDMVEVMDAYHK